MECPRCCAENPDDKSFCGDCGASLKDENEQDEEEVYVRWSGFPYAPLRTESQTWEQYSLGITVGVLFVVLFTIILLVFPTASQRGDLLKIWGLIVLLIVVLGLLQWRSGRRGANS